MGVRFHADEAAKGAAGAIVQGVFVKKIAGGVGRHVVLQGARVEFLRRSPPRVRRRTHRNRGPTRVDCSG